MDTRQNGAEGQPKLFLLGAFALIGADGVDYTPKSKKSKAMLALLALSPRGTRTRIWLRDKLWSSSDEYHASDSLRQTVRDLKRTMAALGKAVLSAETGAVSLCLDSLWVDVLAAQADKALPQGVKSNVDLLEGLDVGDEEFEEWLMLERAAWEKTRDSWADDAPSSPSDNVVLSSGRNAPQADPRSIVIGILPSIAHGGDHVAKFVADFVTEAVARSLAEYQPVRVIDLGESFLKNGDSGHASDPDYLIRSRSLVVGDSASVSFLVYDSVDNSLLLNHSEQFGKDDLIENNFLRANEFIAQNVDHLARIILNPSQQRGGVPIDQRTLIGYRLLIGMFDLDNTRMAQSMALLDHAQDREDSMLFPSLAAYAASFAIGENIGGWDDARSELTEKRIRDVLQANPFNSISLACIGHATGFVLNRHDIAANIFARAVKLNPMQAFVWDHLALHRLYSGDMKGARSASDRAVMLGRYSPISYSYETTACMIATLQGDYEHAVQIGQRSMARQPRFLATMRYTLAALGHLDDQDAARELRSKILACDPGFEDREEQVAKFRLPLKEARERVLSGIAKAGL